MSTYKLVVTGEVLPGFETDEVKTKVALMFKLQDKPVQLAALFSGKNVVVKRKMLDDQAQAYLKAIQGAGLSCELVAEVAEFVEAPVEPPEAPKLSSVEKFDEHVAAPGPDAGIKPAPERVSSNKPSSDLRNEPAPISADESTLLDALAQTEEPVSNNSNEPSGYDPYQQPESDLGVPSEVVDIGLCDEPKKLSAGAGLVWLKEGFQYFKANPWVWIGVTIIFWLMVVVTSIIPLLSLVTTLLMPVFTASFMLACYELHQGEKFGIGELFSGFKNNLGSLLGIGVVYLLGSIVILVGVMAGGFFLMGASMSMSNPENMVEGAGFAMFMILILVGLALMIPLMMAYWFAPALVAIHGVPVFQAMKLSFRGCIKNTVPFLLYGIVAFILMIVATIPIGLGWLIFSPLLFGSMFSGYRQIFTDMKML